jgi:hypothetical protein
LKTEVVHHRDYNTRAEAQRDIFAFIEGFYNRTRLHSAIGYIVPSKPALNEGNSAQPFGIKPDFRQRRRAHRQLRHAGENDQQNTSCRLRGKTAVVRERH